MRGARVWATQAIAFSRAIRFVGTALVNGEVGLVSAPRGRLFRALSFKLRHGKIVEIDVIADRARLSKLELAVLHN